MRPALPALILLAGCSALRVDAPLGPAREGGAPQPPLEVAWRTDAGGAFGRTPALGTSEGVLLTTRRGEVLLVDADGDRRGSVSVGASVDGPAALLGGRSLIIGVDGGRYGLVALDLLEGRTQWRALRGVEVEAGVVVAGGVAVAPALDGVVYGVDVASGEVRWQAPAVPHQTYRAPPITLGDHLVVVASSTGSVVAYRAGSGEVAWRSDVRAPVEEAPSPAAGLLLVPTTRGRLVAVDAATGASRWVVSAANERDRFYTPAVGNGSAYVASSDGVLLAIDAATGEERWRFASDGHVASAPLLAGGHIFAGTLDERLIVLDAATGALDGSYELTGRAKSSPTSLGGLVIVPAEPGLVWAFRTAARGVLP